MTRLVLESIALALLALVGVYFVLAGLHEGMLLVSMTAGAVTIIGGFYVVRRSKKKIIACVLSIPAAVCIVIIVYSAAIPLVVFKIDSRAFPGHMLVEFKTDCPSSTTRVFPHKIEYVIPASGYSCSSTKLPTTWLRTEFLFFDKNQNDTKQPPPLAGGTFFATGKLECRNSSRPYLHKDLAEPGSPGETWYDFTQRVNFNCEERSNPTGPEK